MKFINYDANTGNILNIYDSSVDNIPKPYIIVNDRYWKSIENKDMHVDTSSKTLVFTEKKSTISVEDLRKRAYELEADPLFFQYQRGEVSEDVWLNKIKEIKLRYPKI